MANSRNDSSRAAARRGLTTVALLKAQFDSSKDYLELFMPFVEDAIAQLRRDDFDVGQIRDLVVSRHGLSIPLETLQTLLKRAGKRDLVHREGGKYFRDPSRVGTPTIAKDRKAVEREIHALATAFVTYSGDQGHRLLSEEDAMAYLFGFLSENQVQLLIDEEDEIQYELDTTGLTREQMRLVARFINEKCLPDPHLSGFLHDVVVGFVLQGTLLLRNIGSLSRQFDTLQVYLDSNILFAALGYTGEAAKLATGETIGLLKATNAFPRVFDITVSEVRAILGVYETNLATPEGKERLRPTDLTRYFLTNRFTPSDIRQEIALLERNLTTLGVEIIATPNRIAELTENELELAQHLKRRQERGNEPRIVHDVDCIASVLTLRRGNVTNFLDSARAVFATMSGPVVRSVNDWYASTQLGGTSPIIHMRSLSNAAWLKQPASAAKLKLHELVALCAAALRPSQETWDRFLRHLRRLEESGAISTDEALAVVVSSLTDQALAEMEDSDPDPDADSLTEVVERVKGSYRAEAEALIATTQQEAAQEVATARDEVKKARIDQAAAEVNRVEVIDAVDGKLKQVATLVSWLVEGIGALLLVLGSVALFPPVLDRIDPKLQVLGWVLAGLVSLFALLGSLRGVHLRQIRTRLRDGVHTRLRNWLLKARR